MLDPRQLLRGRPRAPLPLHLVVTRELSAAMRQLRVATGDDTAHTVEVLNATIGDLYPGATLRRTDFGRTSEPHLVTRRYVLAVERGHHARLPEPAWLADRKIDDKTLVFGSRVPAWLVRAYDLAFGADGYLVDMFHWSTALLADHEHNPPRLTRNLPEHIPVGQEYTYLIAPMAGAHVAVEPVVRELLTQQAEQIVHRRTAGHDGPAWQPSAADGSGNLGEAEEDMPEGIVLPAGSWFVARWIVHNIGEVPWRDRWLYRVGQGPTATSLATPYLITVPDTDPGGQVDLRVPVRAPQQPGTYRACLKMGWPNGVYCFPSTLLGLIVTVIVPPADVMAPTTDWTVE